MTTPLAGGNNIINVPIVNGDGRMNYQWIKWFQDAQTRLQNGLDQLGQLIGAIDQSTEVVGRTTVGNLIQNISNAGVVTGNGVDFSLPYINKTTDHIADGSGSPLAGGATAHQALVASTPVAGNSLVYNGTDWVPDSINYSNLSGKPTLPNSEAAVGSNWLNSYDAATGNFTQTQPAFSDISGSAAASQVPALSALSGQITASQLPADVPVVSFGTGAPSAASTEGYIYFDTTGTPYHGYVYHSSAWVQFS